MVRRVFGSYLLRLLNGELRDLCSLSSYYYRFLVSSLFRRYKDKFSYSVKDEKNKTPKLHLPGFGLSHLVFGMVFCSLCVFVGLGYWDREKSEKGKSPLRFCATAFILPSALPALLHIATIVLPLSLSVSLGFNEY